MRRWIHVNLSEGSETFDYSIPKKHFPDSMSDKSHFIPTAEIMHNLEINGSTMHNNLSQYDFKDGNDTGMIVPPNRKGNGCDIAEMEAFARQADFSARNKIREAVAKERMDSSIKRMQDAEKSLSSTDIASSPSSAS